MACLLMGCSADFGIANPFEAVPNVTHLEPEIRTELIRQSIHGKLDVLVVVADADTMADDHAALSGMSEALFGSLRALDFDWQVGVIRAFGDYTPSADLGPSGNPFDTAVGVIDVVGPPEPEGTLVASDRGVRIITRESPDPVRAFQTMALLGAEGKGTEARIFDAIKLFFDGPLSWMNDGFRREDALLHIVVISDLDDSSEEPVDQMADFVRGLGPQGTVVVHSITSPDPDRCGKGEGVRVVALRDALRGSGHSICSSLWPTSLVDEMDTVVERNRWFPLSQIAVPNSIELQVIDGDWVYSGVQVKEGVDIAEQQSQCTSPCAAYQFDPIRNAIGFIDFRPTVNARVEVQYELARAWTPEDGRR